jgi:cystathionine gamma-lyase
VLSSTFHLGVPGEETPTDFYGRAGNPTWRALEDAIGALDGGECVTFASGMAAIAAVLRLTGRDGALVLPSDGYYLARSLAHAELAPLGVEVRETPTAAGQRPLELGADLVIASDTKALAGHGDVVLGHVSARDPELVARLREARSRGGAVPGPMEAWLAHRGLATLDLRLARQAQNAAALVPVLREHPAVADVRWPGDPADPAHGVASRQMRRWNGVLRFTLSSEAAVGEFLGASRLVGSATSFGGPRSTADRRQRWGDAVAPGLLRFSAGCEDPADLVADVRSALAAITR